MLCWKLVSWSKHCFPSLMTTQSALQYLPYTDGSGCNARCQLHIRSKLGISVLPKDTLTCSSAQSWGARIWTSNLPTTRLPALTPEPLYLMLWFYPLSQVIQYRNKWWRGGMAETETPFTIFHVCAWTWEKYIFLKSVCQALSSFVASDWIFLVSHVLFVL